MRLRLTITNPPPGFAGHADSWEFGEEGGTIGRAERNDLQLPDPSKVISSQHARISRDAGEWLITDLSTNGVYLNGSETPVGRGRQASVRNGDRLRIGDYDIVAEFETEALPSWPGGDSRADGDWGGIPNTFQFEAARGDAGLQTAGEFIRGQATLEQDRAPDIHSTVKDLPRLVPEDWAPGADAEAPRTGPTQPWAGGGEDLGLDLQLPEEPSAAPVGPVPADWSALAGGAAAAAPAGGAQSLLPEDWSTSPLTGAASAAGANASPSAGLPDDWEALPITGAMGAPGGHALPSGGLPDDWSVPALDGAAAGAHAPPSAGLPDDWAAQPMPGSAGAARAEALPSAGLADDWEALAVAGAAEALPDLHWPAADADEPEPTVVTGTPSRAPLPLDAPAPWPGPSAPPPAAVVQTAMAARAAAAPPRPAGYPPAGGAQPAPVAHPPGGVAQPAPVAPPPVGGAQPAPVARPPVGGVPPAPVAHPPVGGVPPAPVAQPPTGGAQAAAGPLPGVAGEPADNGLEQALAALLAGAGVPDLRPPLGATPAFFHAVGEMLALYGAGSVQLVQGVSAIRDTFRIQQTQVRNVGNNPLRWIPQQHAVRKLLAPELDGFMAPTAAVHDVMNSVVAHQIGVIRAMEAAFRAFLNGLAPAQLEQRFDANGKPGVLANRKAWCWEQYAEHHRRLAEAAEENWLELLGDDFVKAYEEQVRAVRAQPRQDHLGNSHGR